MTIRDLDHLKELMATVETPFGTFRFGEDTPPPPVGVSAIPKWDMTGDNARPPEYKGPLWLQFVMQAPDYTRLPAAVFVDVGSLGEMSLTPGPLEIHKPPMLEQHGRKWRISRHMTRREVVATAFQAVLSAMEHEVRESFTWCGLAVFGPHMPLEALAEVAEKYAPDARG